MTSLDGLDGICLIPTCSEPVMDTKAYCRTHFGGGHRGAQKVGDTTVHLLVEEAVDHPAHYGGADDPYETIKVLEAWMTPEQLHGFCVGNSIKYMSRAGKKDKAKEIEDLRKAAWYAEYAAKLKEGPRA